MPSPHPWVLLQHVPYEGPGAIADAIAAAGQELSVITVDAEDVPTPHDVGRMRGLIVMGGPMGVHDGHSWLVPERELLRAAVTAGLPVLGVCLGAQQLALALGGTVATGPAPEIGAGDVALTAAGQSDPVLGPGGSPLSCLHWHGDTFSLPDGAVLLASTDVYAHQAFRVGERAYGLQFHVEVTPALVEGWRPHLPPGVDVSETEAQRVSASGRPALDRFIALSG